MRSDMLDTKDIQLKMPINFEVVVYNGYGKKSEFKHMECGSNFEMRIDHMLKRKKCPNCHHRKRTLERFQIESDKKHNFEYEILEFNNGNESVKIKHKNCGSIFYQTGFRHLRGNRCDKCYGNLKLSKSDIINKSNEIWENEYTILSDDISYTMKSDIKHNLCGKSFTQLISSHLGGAGCPHCAKNIKHTIESIQNKSNEIHNYSYDILSKDVGNSKSKIEIKHHLCGRVFKQVITDHLTGCGCPYCRLSKGELHIQNILQSRNIVFERQAMFNGCKYKNRLKFDFYVPSLNLCIEYDGQQHFFPVHWFGGVKAYELQLLKDSIKTEYCESNCIKLIRFKYTDNKEFIESSLLNIIK